MSKGPSPSASPRRGNATTRVLVKTAARDSEKDRMKSRGLSNELNHIHDERPVKLAAVPTTNLFPCCR